MSRPQPINQPRVETKPNEIYRFSPESLTLLERQLPKPGVTAETTPLQAGMMLGVQMVLDKLRNGFTVG